MSEENVELVRRIHERWDRGESISELVADDLEYVNPTYAVEPGTRVGRKMFGSVRETYPDFLFHPQRYIDAVKDGVAVRFQWFQSHAEALKAAGVTE